MPRKKKPTIDTLTVELATEELEEMRAAISELPKKLKRTDAEDVSLCGLRDAAYLLFVTIQDLFDKE